jgi:hypothetical protein
MRNSLKDLKSSEIRNGGSWYSSLLRSESLDIRILLVLSVFFGYSVTSYPTPGFARQTGMSCTACHNIFPQLNSFGRSFKLNGYTLVTVSTIDDTGENGKNRLKLLTFSPFAVMAQASFSRLNKELPGTQNNNVEFPQQLSMFFSGLITPRIGAFIQFSYDQQGGAFGIDNVDIRYSNQTKLASKEFIYGFTLNNNPTVQDVWNSTPAWGYPFASSAVAPSPSGSTLIEGGLAQQVAGLGGYSLFNNLVYTEFSLYRSAPQGAADPPGSSSNMIIKGLAPYWRLAFQHQWSAYYVELGTYGLYTKFFPTGVSGQTNDYTDLGIDLQIEHSLPKGNIILHSTWIHEIQNLNASFVAGNSQNEQNMLNSFKIDGSAFFNKGYGFTLAYFMTSGTPDMMLFTPGPVNGSRSGKPDSDGFILQLNYIPWHNMQFSLQYVINNKFNGSKINYDDNNRNASANNTLYLLTWINF